MHGYLRLFVIHIVAGKESTGYGIIKKIEEKTGGKPSAGTMYPLLEKLAEEGVVSVRKQGDKKFYSLTKKGEDEHKKLHDAEDQIMAKLEENIKMIDALMGTNHAASMFPSIKGAANSHMIINHMIMTKIKPGADAIRDNIMKAVKGKKSLEKINAILLKAASDIGGIR